MRLVFASNNAHKLEEVRAMMPAGVEVLSLREIGFEHEIDETGTTLEENSAIKSEAVWEFINGRNGDAALNGGNGGLMIDGVFADDTGLEINALCGEPGVYTARWYKREPTLTLPKEKGMTDEMLTFHCNRAKALPSTSAWPYRRSRGKVQWQDSGHQTGHHALRQQHR